MDKNKEIEEMAEQIEQSLLLANRVVGSMNKGKGHWIASYLVEKGYGNVKQAVEEFAEKLKNSFYNLEYSAISIDNKIDNLITELYGADEKEINHD